MKKLLITLSIGALLASTNLYAGAESGGGGGVVFLGETPVLMDYFTILDDVNNIPSSDKGQPVSKDSLEVLITSENESNIRLNFKAFDKAFDVLDRWSSKSSGIISTMVRIGMESPVKWSFVDHQLDAPPFFIPKAMPEGLKTKVAAFYSNQMGNTKVSINKTLWNQLTLNDQTGLLIHEALRQTQIGMKNQFDDESLQRATAIYLLCNPSDRLNYYLFYVLSNNASSADSIYGPFYSFIKNECRRIDG